MTEWMVLDEIEFDVDVQRLLRRVHVSPDSDDAAAVRELAAEAAEIARPKALYRAAGVDAKGEDGVTIEGVAFRSRVLSVNLEGVYRVFPFVATCGRELMEWSEGVEGVLEPYWADAVKHMALRAARSAVREHARESFQPGKLAEMNPGSLDDWPLGEQKGVFELLDGRAESIGVELTDSFLMVPTKSISGILFPAEFDYDNCRLCPRENCPGRRAPYQESLWRTRYARSR